MTCPNCGKEFDHDVRVCPVCDTPLSNAIYTPIPASEKNKKTWILPLILLLLASIVAGGYYFYQFYTKEFRRNCRSQTESLFTHLSTMDISDWDPSCLPLPLQETPDISAKIEKVAYQEISQSSLSEIINETDHPFDIDRLTEQILNHASYRIVKVSNDLTHCKVTVEVSNLDYQHFIQNLADKTSVDLQADESLWKSISHSVKSFFFGEEDHTEDIRQAALSAVEREYDACLTATPRKKYTGEITYSISPKSDSKIYLEKFDINLLNAYYGIELFDPQ